MYRNPFAMEDTATSVFNVVVFMKEVGKQACTKKWCSTMKNMQTIRNNSLFEFLVYVSGLFVI